MNHQELCNAIETSFYKNFPKSVCVAVVSNSLGTCLYVKFTLGSGAEEFTNKIIQNDPMYQVITVDGLTRDGGYSDKLEISGGSGIDVKHPNPAYYCTRVKVFRKSTVDSPEKVAKKLNDYFAKLKDVVVERADDIQPLVGDLYSVKSKVDA